MPKLHFYDTGLACWLLGIRTTDHLRAHPLRGPLFETWVVSEIMKHRTNRGEAGGSITAIAMGPRPIWSSRQPIA